MVVINGPNLNLLGTRQPDIYGTTTLADLERDIAAWAAEHGLSVEFLQSNHEGEIIDAIHRAEGSDGVVLNPGAYAHTSRAIADAVASIETPVVEVHISNVKRREPWRAVSVLEGVVTRSIYGRGLVGYRDALRLLINLRTPPTTLPYGPHTENVGDLRVPQGARTVVMLIHGGFWLAEWGRDTMDSLALELHRRGVATWNVEYRRSGVGGAWPGSIEDVRLAFGYLRSRSELATAPVSLLGHSAGGYLALALAGDTDVTATRVLAPITDLSLMSDDEGLGADIAGELLDAGAPSRVDGRDVRAVHGLSDQLVSPQHSKRLPDAEVELLPGIGHFELLDPGQAPGETALLGLGQHG